MEKTFRDILAEFLEGNDGDFTSNVTAAAAEKSGFPSGNHDLPSGFETFWLPEFIPAPNAAKPNRYKSSTPAQAKIATPPPPPPKVEAPEVLIPLEKLSKSDQARVRELISLGASNLTQGLSERRLKKAHRLLARKFHPDRLGKNASPAEVREASANFVTLQEAYAILARTFANK